MKREIVILFIFVTLSTAQKPLPKYIEACKRNDPKLNECFAKSANRAIQQMVKGDEEYGVPSAMPFKPQDVDFSAPGIHFTLMNIIVHGAESVKIVDPQIVLENKTMKFYLTSPMIIWEGDYLAEVDKPIEFGILQKKGHVKLHFGNGKFSMYYKFALENMNGTNYARIIEAKEGVETVDLSIAANKAVNGLTDEEWNILKAHIINDDFLLVCAKSVALFMQAIFNVVPYDDVFPL